MSRASGRMKPCQPADIRARLKDAADFLEAAELLSAPGKGDVVATNAIHSAIASADVICCAARPTVCLTNGPTPDDKGLCWCPQHSASPLVPGRVSVQ